MKIKKKHKNWLIIGLAIVGILILAKALYTPANILSGQFYLQPFIVIGPGEIAYTDDTFEHTFTLTNKDTQTLPASLDTNADGIIDRVIELWYGWNIVDPNKITVDHGCTITAGTGACEDVQQITTSMSSGATYDVATYLLIDDGHMSGDPDNNRFYGASAILFKITSDWDRATNTWTDHVDEIIDASCIDPPTCSVTNPALSVKFDAITARPYTPAGIDAWATFRNLFTNIWAFLKSLFEWL